MKYFRLSIAFLSLAALLSGCFRTLENGDIAAGHTAAAPVEPVSLRYMIWDSEQAAAYNKIIGLFMAKHPNIIVDMQVVPRSNYWEKVMTDTAGGAAPDVFWGYIPRVPSLAGIGALLPLTSFIKRDNLDLAAFNKDLVKAFAYKGEQYGIPKDWDTLGVFYNKKLLSQAGFDHYPEHLAWNPQDGGTLVPFLQKLTFDHNGKHPNEAGFDPGNIVQYGLNFTSLGEWDPSDFVSFTASNGTEILKNGRFEPDQKRLETFQFLHDLVFKYDVAPDFTTVKTAGSDQMFFTSRTALWISGTWEMKTLSDNAGFKWGAAPFPAGPDGKSIVRVNGLADHISAQTKHPNEAWQFVKFIGSKEAQDILAETGTVFPISKTSIPKFINYYKDLGVDPTLFVKQYEGETVTPPVTENYGEWVEVWYRTMGLIFSGEIDLQTGLHRIETIGNPIAARKTVSQHSDKGANEP
jgi:multiple sugar transport system substrate-binding protein